MSQVLLSYHSTEAPDFIERVFIEVEDDGQIAIGIMKTNGDAYAYARISRQQWLNAVAIIALAAPDDPPAV